ncbi:hypothetical protein GE061_015953 [Apolygus lucorum]|uniref:Uncharacterized protein n=1 Tax=Apolygus lucorum TaxID=248454 RepID=A0A8S9XEU0_APOLU|nr:hypothetical protein GE061_015953 [Apolygus lucorum]
MWSEGEEDDISDGELMDLSELVQGILSSEGVTLKEKVDYSGNLRYTSIRPRNKPHDPVVTDIRWLQYDPAVIIRYKLKFDDGFQDLPRRPRASQVDVYPQLHNDPLAIPKDKWDYLQSLKPCLPKESWNFYDNLPHQSESIRKAKRESKKPQRKD